MSSLYPLMEIFQHIWDMTFAFWFSDILCINALHARHSCHCTNVKELQVSHCLALMNCTTLFYLYLIFSWQCPEFAQPLNPVKWAFLFVGNPCFNVLFNCHIQLLSGIIAPTEWHFFLLTFSSFHSFCKSQHLFFAFFCQNKKHQL